MFVRETQFSFFHLVVLLLLLPIATTSMPIPFSSVLAKRRFFVSNHNPHTVALFRHLSFLPAASKPDFRFINIEGYASDPIEGGLQGGFLV